MNNLWSLQLSKQETKELVNDFRIGIMSLEETLFNKNEIDKIASEIEEYLLKNHTKEDEE
ncbi:MAG: hypothetical protein JXB49_29305 [Bacteroidales bacterium]|nr:hypothetical protein [Bacteroidales bacterium]